LHLLDNFLLYTVIDQDIDFVVPYLYSSRATVKTVTVLARISQWILLKATRTTFVSDILG